MLKYFVEFLGTFLFLSVVIATGNALLISLALLAVLLMGAAISGGHFNPAISVMMWFNGALSLADLGLYVAAQVGGGIAALGLYKMFLAPISVIQ
jgi:aquaporin Z